MATTHPTSRAEVKVQIRTEDSPWRDSLDLDPVLFPVETSGRRGDPISTDVFDDAVYAAVTAICELEAGDSRFTHRLVWSSTGHEVRGTCPVCDDDFIVAEGMPGDQLNEGYDAVCCGCDPLGLG